MWKEAAGSVTFVAVAAAIDKLLLSRHKLRIHDSLTRYWVRLDDAAMPDIPVLVARKTLRVALSFLGGKWMSSKALWRYLAISLILTSFAVIAGLATFHHIYAAHVQPFIDQLIALATKSHEKKSDEVTQIFIAARSFQPSAFPFRHPLWFAELTVFNMFFDLASIACTITLLGGVLRYGSRFAWAFILADACVAVGCGIGSLCIGVAFSFFAASGFVSGNTAQRGAAFVSWIVAMVTALPYSLTTLAPTALLLSLLGLAHAVKIVLSLSKRFSLALMERATEDKPESCMPATILASGMWLMLTGVWGVWLLLTALSHAMRALL